jgi:thiol-disulfide isomerase/thioredoxin
MAGNGKKDATFQAFLVIACVALSALVIALAWQNRTLKADLAAAHSRATQNAIPAGALKDGDRLEPFDLVAAGTNTPLELGFDGTGEMTLLLVFSSTCPACQETFPGWNELVAALPRGTRVVGIQSDLASAGPVAAARFPVYGFEGARPATMDKIPFVPCTATIAADGTVSNVIFGVPTAEQRATVRAALGS